MTKNDYKLGGLIMNDIFYCIDEECKTKLENNSLMKAFLKNSDNKNKRMSR